MIKSHEPIGDFAKRYHEEMEKESRKTENVYAPEARVLVVDDVPMNLLTANAVLVYAGRIYRLSYQTHSGKGIK